MISLFDASARLAAAYTRDASDIHANQSETSLLMHLRPEMVRPDLAIDEPDVTPDLVFSYDMPATTRSGVVGHARRASAGDGRALVDMLVEDISGIVRRLWWRIGRCPRGRDNGLHFKFAGPPKRG